MKRGSAEALDRMFGRLVRELGAEGAEKVVTIMAEEIGAVRLVFPDLPTIGRMIRNQQICSKFTGSNHEELALRYQKHPRQIRRILQQQRVFVVTHSVTSGASLDDISMSPGRVVYLTEPDFCTSNVQKCPE